MSAKPSKIGTALRVSASFVTMMIVIVMFALVAVARPARPVDDVSSSGSSSSHEVRQRQITAYCPARMSLPDATSYGDSEYQPSEGNIASTVRYAAFGAVYQAQFWKANDSAGERTTLADADPTDDSRVLAASADANNEATIMSTQLLESAAGAGATASVASSASEGDLRGVSAAVCQTPALEHSFVLSGTPTGTTQQLVVDNPSAKATTVAITAWGTSQDGPIVFSTGSTLTVGANNETVLDLSAAASGQDALFVKVTSRQTPISAVVRTVSMDGLTAKGSDWQVPLATQGKQLVFPTLAEGDKAALIVYAKDAGSVETQWLGKNDAVSTEASSHDYAGGKVTVIDLSSAPKGTQALSIRAEESVAAAVRVVRAGENGQEDFALINAASPASSSAIAIPDGLQSRLALVNTAQADTKATIVAYDSEGRLLAQRDVELGTDETTSLNTADLVSDDAEKASVAIVSLENGQDIAWGVRLSSNTLDKAKVAGVAYLGSSSLMPRNERIWADRDMTIVR